ncbi:MAG: transposase [Bacteroidetes bacterium HGW-Bacteroidetes-21]|nr:MAG: transposase [Bacteroidetes bacterium HGW-Bacteroidetes-21]
MKRTYHTDIIIQYKLGLLSSDIIKQIPSSTIHNWKTRSVSEIFGLDNVNDIQQHIMMIKDIMAVKSLLKLTKTLYTIYNTYNTILKSIPNRNKILRNSQDIIIKTIENVKENIGKKRALKAFGVSAQQYYSWKRKMNCKLIPQTFCRKKYKRQLTINEVNTIKNYLNAPEIKNWGLSSVYYKILRDKKAFFSKTSFYKYARILNLWRKAEKKVKYGKGIRATKPKEILHMDITKFKTKDQSKVNIYFIVDNYSRCILGWKASTEYSANIAFENLKEVYHKHNLNNIPFIELITDGGSENKGKVSLFANDCNNNIKKLIAQTDIILSNSMIESVNKRIKYDFLYRNEIISPEDLYKLLAIIVEEYNNKPHSALFGLTPNEVLKGQIPDKNLFANDITNARKKRYTINNNEACLSCY